MDFKRISQWMWPPVVDKFSCSRAVIQGVLAASVAALYYLFQALRYTGGRFWYEDLWLLYNVFLAVVFVFAAFRIKKGVVPAGVVALGALFYELIITIWTDSEVAISVYERGEFIYSPDYLTGVLASGVLGLMVVNSMRGMYGNYRLKLSVGSAAEPKTQPARILALFFYVIIFVIVFGMSVLICLLTIGTIGPKSHNIALRILGLIASLICFRGIGKILEKIFETNQLDNNFIIKILTRLILFVIVLWTVQSVSDIPGIFNGTATEKKPDYVKIEKTLNGKHVISIRGR